MIDKLSLKTREILNSIHKSRINNKKGLRRVENYLTLNSAYLRKNFFKNKVCADIGCGNHAGNGKSMLRLGAKYVELLDVNSNIKGDVNKNLRKYKNKYNLNSGSVNKLPFKSNHFDVINCSGVIHHTKYDSKSFKEIHRVLKKGGTAFIVVHGEGGLITKFVMEILRPEYKKNLIVKKVIDEIIENKFKKNLPFFKKNLKNKDFQKIKKLFKILEDNDLRMTLKDRILSPRYKLYNYKDLKTYLKKIGFYGIKRTPIKPYFNNIRDLIAPVYAHPDKTISRFFYGDGMLRFICKKK